ncbi:MAG: helix-turn-helix domain-containing protein [Firmicutes bacterium]|nr:helix-turn-helix domain-containing protein [Bacillota bacterium]
MAGHPFGELLRTLRRRHGLTQAELGRGFCTKAHISAIETGVRAPSGHVVRHLLERLPERRALAEALVASYPPRADWLQAGLALALWGEVAGARTILNALTQLPRGTTGHGARALAWTRFLDGRLDQAVPLLRGGVEHYRRRGHFREAAWALWELGMMLAEAAPGPDALWCFREARRTWTRQGDQADQRFRAIVLHSEARALQRMGAHRRAEEQAAKAARLYRALGDQVGEGHALLEAAHAAHGAGALERGRLLADEARERFLSTGHAPCLGIAELAVAIALLDQGPARASEAAQRLARAEANLAQTRPELVLFTRSERARLALLQGDLAGARALVEAALQAPAPSSERAHQLCLAAAVGQKPWPEARQELLRLAGAIPSPWERHATLRSAARLCMQLGRWRWAAELYQAGESWWEAWWDPSDPEASTALSGVSR